MAYDSRADTLFHSQRVGELMIQMIKEMLDRSHCHDRSKTESPEVEVFNEFTPKLRELEYGSEEYKNCLKKMQEGLYHHYAVNAHHPEHNPVNGVNGMTIVDLVEMMADWKAATERTKDGDFLKSLEINKKRFNLSNQTVDIMINTARRFGWVDD